MAEVLKLMGNSSYGKLIEALERQTTMKYTTSESVLRKELRSVWSRDLGEIVDMYKIEWKSTNPSRWG